MCAVSCVATNCSIMAAIGQQSIFASAAIDQQSGNLRPLWSVRSPFGPFGGSGNLHRPLLVSGPARTSAPIGQGSGEEELMWPSREKLRSVHLVFRAPVSRSVPTGLPVRKGSLMFVRCPLQPVSANGPAGPERTYSQCLRACWSLSSATRHRELAR